MNPPRLERNLMHTAARPAANGQPDPRRWLVLAILSGSLLLIAMDTTILNVAFPSLVSDLQPGSVEQLWIIDVYALALSGLLVTAGALGDRWGRKRMLLTGFSVFAFASLLAVFSTEAWHVIAARALLGVGGAAIMPSTLSILRNVFTDARERAFAFAVWAAVFGGGMALGPVIGGLLVQDFGWQSAFLLNLPVAAVIIALGAWFLPESSSPRGGRWDWWGVVQSVVGMLALAGGIKQLGKSGLASPLPWALLLLAAVALTVFVRRQLRLENPLLQVRLFTNRSFSVAASAIFLGMVGMGAVLFLATQWLQYAHGFTPFTAGLRLLPAPLGLIATSVVTPALMQRFPIRHILGAGLVVMAVGLALPWTVQRFTDIGYPALAVGLAILGLGVGVATTVASVTLMAATPADEVGGAAAIEETCYELGAALGVAILGSLATALYRGGLPALGLDGPTADSVRDSIGEAAHVAHQIGGPAGDALLRTVAGAYTDAITPAFLAAAGLSLAAAAMAWTLIPHDLRPTDNAH
ncbi:MFS transporter [Streptomyces sp. NPDC057654]|uniref:MFS transporter n=1 Tax=Streptomyces sp. NPDC057654 TaxID=3346196 RepID=UPI0036A28D8C